MERSHAEKLTVTQLVKNFRDFVQHFVIWNFFILWEVYIPPPNPQDGGPSLSTIRGCLLTTFAATSI